MMMVNAHKIFYRYANSIVTKFIANDTSELGVIDMVYAIQFYFHDWKIPFDSWVMDWIYIFIWFNFRFVDFSSHHLHIWISMQSFLVYVPSSKKFTTIDGLVSVTFIKLYTAQQPGQ